MPNNQLPTKSHVEIKDNHICKKNLLTNLLDQWLLTSFVVPELLKLVQLPTILLQYVDYKPLPSPSLGLSHTESQVL